MPTVSQLCLTLHFMCVQIFHMVNVDVPAGVGAPPLDPHPLKTGIFLQETATYFAISAPPI